MKITRDVSYPCCRMRKLFLTLLLAAVLLPAQDHQSQLPGDVVAYFELTDPQMIQIDRANLELATLTDARLQRWFAVQGEINLELQKADPDPMALGLRQRELESIRRELKAQRESTVTAVQSFLTATQKQKLAPLAEAIRLYGAACNATSSNFLTPAPQVLIGGVGVNVSPLAELGGLTICNYGLLTGGTAGASPNPNSQFKANRKD
ncbi:MAG: hypothetical protein H7039_00720 [Bryobacteraceae bacterium]|nr:hypothetical protein [Bryobacteraceae bacterium]